MNARTIAGVQAQINDQLIVRNEDGTFSREVAPSEYTVRVVGRLGNESYSYAPVLTWDAARDMIDDELADPATKYAELHYDVMGRHIVTKYMK